MQYWQPDPSYEDLRTLALKLEAAFNAANGKLLHAAGVTHETLVDRLAEVQAKLLRFDAHARRRFADALEEKRVKSLAQGNVFMACVLCSAVALSEFKNAPRPAASGALGRRLDSLRRRSTNGLTLSAFTTASFYTLLGKGALDHLGARRQRKTIQHSRD